LTALTSAPPSPDTNLSGTRTTRVSRRRFGSALTAAARPAASGPWATPDHDLAGIQGPAGEQGAGQNEVGRPGKQHRVLGAAGLAVAAVHPDDRLAATGSRRRGRGPELVAERECRAAPAAQVDAFREVDELSRGHPAHRAEDLLMLAQADVREPVQASG
jgi:hypothetical protein